MTTTSQEKGRHKRVTVKAKLMLMWRFLEPSKNYFLTLSQGEKLEVKGEIWKQIDRVFDLDQLKPWDDLDLETYEYHLPEKKIAQFVKARVAELEPERGFGLTIDPRNSAVSPPSPALLAYNKHSCTRTCCDHGYALFIRSNGGEYRPWVIASRISQITVQMLAVLVWESPFPPEWRFYREAREKASKTARKNNASTARR